MIRALSHPQIEDSYKSDYSSDWICARTEAINNRIDRLSHDELDVLVQSEAKILHALIAFERSSSAISLIAKTSSKYLSLPDKHGLTPLCWAAWNNLKDVGQALVKKMSPEQLIDALEKDTLILHWICLSANKTILALVAQQIPLTSLNQIKVGRTTLLWHALEKRCLKISPDTMNFLKPFGQSRLEDFILRVIYNGDTEYLSQIMKMLSQEECNTLKIQGKHMLHWALMNRHIILLGELNSKLSEEQYNSVINENIAEIQEAISSQSDW